MTFQGCSAVAMVTSANKIMRKNKRRRGLGRKPAKPFEEGHKRSRGRPPGSQNVVTKAIKDAILGAAEALGGPGGAEAYLIKVGRKDPRTFCALLGRVLPLQVDVQSHHQVVYKTLDEVKAELKRRGMPDKEVLQLQHFEPVDHAEDIIEGEFQEVAHAEEVQRELKEKLPEELLASGAVCHLCGSLQGHKAWCKESKR